MDIRDVYHNNHALGMDYFCRKPAKNVMKSKNSFKKKNNKKRKKNCDVVSTLMLSAPTEVYQTTGSCRILLQNHRLYPQRRLL